MRKSIPRRDMKKGNVREERRVEEEVERASDKY